MADQHRYPSAHGDEADLFRSYNDELMQAVANVLGGRNPHVIEDACAFAWAQFLQHQPSRDQNYRGWLFRTAQRKAYELDTKRREHLSLSETPEVEDWTYSRAQRKPPDPFDTRIAVNEAFEVLDALPDRLRRVAVMRALGLQHQEIGELMGVSDTRAGQLVAEGSLRLQELVGEQRRAGEPSSPRAERLMELEENPPRWLTSRIGQPPRSLRRRKALSETKRLWRRAALAIDDLRQAAGPDFDQPQRLDLEFTDLQARAAAAIDALTEYKARRARRGIER